MLINLLNEYIVGTPFESISPQIFRVLSEFCHEVGKSVERDKNASIRSLPTLNDQYQSMARLQTSLPNVLKEFEAVRKKLEISRFANNDISLNNDIKLSTKGMFADITMSPRTKLPAGDFDDIRY